MAKKILMIPVVFVLCLLPFIVGGLISGYSPYVETNSFKTYVIIWAAISIAFASIALIAARYYSGKSGYLWVGGLCLFLLISPIAGVFGLAQAPDLSLKMLDHPEREHLRYIFLLIGAFLFLVFSLFLLKSNALQISNAARLLITLLIIAALVELFWELSHHYLYPEALKDWMAQGKDHGDFGKQYDNLTVINIGVIGRLIQFSLIVILSIRLYQLRQVRFWCPLVITIVSLAAIASAITIAVTQMNLPKGFEFLFIFFIPGMPLLLLYWLGVDLVTKRK